MHVLVHESNPHTRIAAGHSLSIAMSTIVVFPFSRPASDVAPVPLILLAALPGARRNLVRLESNRHGSPASSSKLLRVKHT